MISGVENDRLQLPAGSPLGVSHSLREVYLTLLRRLSWPHSGPTQGLRTLGLTSCYSGEGVSTVATQLAVTAAASDKGQVLLVDANLARPSLRQTFDLAPKAGLAEVLLDRVPRTEAIQKTMIDGLSVLPAGTTQGDLAQAFDSAELATLTRELRFEFDLVVFDMPATRHASSPLRLAGLLDGVVLVVEAERVRREVARNEKQLLAGTGAQLLGVVLNKRPQHVPDWLYRTL